ncbi:MAG: protein MnhE [Desulfobacteraceae bacterium]|nr:MAG: protein MnhE [Desulfobacteraceae bacterium]
MNRFDKDSSKSAKRNRRLDPGAFVLTLCITSVFWLFFSGRFDLFHLLLGAVSCMMVSVVTHRLLFPKGVRARLGLTWFRVAGYMPWLFKQILQANLHVLYLTFHPSMMRLINPKTIEFKSRLTSDVARTTLANSITLTPGTITVYSDVLGVFVVHCIDDRSGQDLPGEMEERIGRVFDE